MFCFKYFYEDLKTEQVFICGSPGVGWAGPECGNRQAVQTNLI
jgi:hypothetical protein